MSHEHVLERSNLSLVVLECKLESHIGDHDAARTYAHASTDGSKQMNRTEQQAPPRSLAWGPEYLARVVREFGLGLVWVPRREEQVCRGLPRSLG